MRTRHWLKSLLGGALWTATAAVGLAPAGVGWAQDGYGGGYTPYIDPGSPAAAQYAPAYSGIEAAGWPPGASQWPYISPHTAPAIDQHSHQNGFWFNEKIIGKRKYYAYLAGGLSSYADPDDVLVGDPNAPRDFRNIAVVGGNAGAGNLVGSREVFAAHDWSEVEDTMSGGTFQGMLGWFNEDDSGWFANGFWAEEGVSSLTLIDPVGDPQRPVDTLRARAGIPIFDGSTDTLTLPPNPPDTTGITVTGAGVIPYDMYYRLAWQSQAYGAGLGFYVDPLFRGGAIKLRPVMGLKYMNVRENATFEGGDSGLNYTINGANLSPVAGSITGTPAVFIDGTAGFQSELRSNTKSQLAGPELGLRLDVGSDRFNIWTQSKLGIWANHSTRELDGFGIGRPLGAALPIPTTPTPNDPALTGFHDQDTTTHVSPAFEQAVFVRSPLLSYVPVVNKMKVFEEAQFQMGYTFLVVGAMYRPGNVIDWRGFPQFPELNSERTTWYMTTWSWGVEWTY